VCDHADRSAVVRVPVPDEVRELRAVPGGDLLGLVPALVDAAALVGVPRVDGAGLVVALFDGGLFARVSAVDVVVF
jgi:hypothetical protein